jgi:hypothetical protein
MINSTVNLPLTKVYVNNKYLGLNIGHTEAYWYGITSIPARQFLCHVMLIDGSNWYGIPLEAISTKPCDIPDSSITQGYDCFSYDISCIRFDFLRDQRVKIKHGIGTYLFTVISLDPNGSAPFAEFPEQAKTFVFIALDNGWIVSYPNNYIQWTDSSLYNIPNKFKKYKRINKIYRSEK